MNVVEIVAVTVGGISASVIFIALVALVFINRHNINRLKRERESIRKNKKKELDA